MATAMRKGTLLGTLALVAMIAAGSFVGRWGGEGGAAPTSPSGDDDRTDYFSSAELVAASQAIVVGRVVGERDETFNFRSAATGEVAAGLTEHVLTVEIASVLKGQVRAGDRIAVLQTSQNSTVSRTGGDTRNALEVLPLTKEDSYVFFLVPVSMPPEFKGYETSTWGRPGEPGFAKLNNGTLEFMSTERYRLRAERRGLTLVDGGAPFAADLKGIESLAGK